MAITSSKSDVRPGQGNGDAGPLVEVAKNIEQKLAVFSRHARAS
jgi:hypothetical protein